ncbi:hypothetical protein THRCLA_10799 [Thraustotheca clavata]|uniref:Uncharacterized protein n=1 Tax=Thraustotheca clavata TaxID=74557 RepID=A0A1V9YGE2_9STRA|nr:hypothetical protein THRCLA_10799 [Thraustotheca clavata]
MSQSTTVTITNILITESTAAKGGGFYMIDCTIQGGDLVNATIANTSAVVMGGAMYLVLVDMIAKNIKSMHTSGESGGMLASEDSNVQLTNSNIKYSTAKSNGGAFYCIISSVILQQSRVHSHSAGANGGALYGFSSTVSFQDSTIFNNMAATGGAISVSSSTLNIYRSKLFENNATNGGAINAGLSDVTIELSELSSNAASGVGGALSITENSITAVNSLLHDNQAVQGGAMALSQLSTFTLHSCIVSSNSLLLSQSADILPFGGAISLNVISADSYVINSTFQNNTAGVHNGGAFYATMGSTLAAATLHVTTSLFSNCQGGYGGAFYLTGMKTALNQSSWTLNAATTGGGGGIYWTGIEPLGLQSQSYNGNTAIFGPNFASVPYGLQPNYTPVVDCNGSVIGEASGVNFIGTFHVYIVDQYMQTVATESTTQVTLTSETSGALITGAGKATAVNGVCNFATTGVQQVPGLNVSLALSSGNLKPLRTVLVRVRQCVRGEVTPAGVDQCLKCPYGQFSWNTSESSCHTCPIGAVCGGGDDIQALDGYWRFPNSTGVCTNHYDDCTLKECLDVACNGLVKSSDSAMVRLNTGINGTVALILSSNSTEYNENDTLFIQGASYKVVQATSLGTNQSSQIQLLVTGTTELPTTGGVAIYQVVNESCKTGYAGHLCFQCDIGYTRSGKTACIACPNNYTLTILVLVGGVFACIAVAIVLIQMTINKSRTKADLYSIICKIFTSYLQLVSLAGSFDLQWPAEVNAMFNAQSAASNPADKLISIDCLLDYYKRGTSMDSLSSYYEQLILYLCLPVLCVIFPVVFWRLRHKLIIKRLTRREWAPLLQSTIGRGTGGDPLIQSSEVEDVLKAVGEKPTDIVVMGTCTVAKLDEGSQPLSVVKSAYLEALRSEIQDKTVLSIIVLMFLVHPGVTKQIFQMFTCTVLGEDDDGKPLYFLDPDLDVPCYNFSHYRWMLCCGLPSIIGITFGIPGFAWYVLRARRTMLDDPRIKLQFGFLYDGYKLEYYYWEIWIMMRKVLVSVISVFLKNWGAIPQSLGATGLTFFALYLHMNSMPFELEVVNNLEETALLTCLITLYCGLYFYQPQVTGGARFGIGVVVLIVNGIFFLKFGRLVSQELKKKALDGLAKMTQHKRVSVVINKFRGSKVDLPVQPEFVEIQLDHDNSIDENAVLETDEVK